LTRIVIFCDGTWNSPTQAFPTHVHRLFSVTKASVDQRPVYIPGVGTGVRQGNLLGKVFDKIGGGAFGWGLDQNIQQAYRALALSYRRGDEILIFGFSRGAYTARSLAGMIRKCGIIEDPTADRVAAAFRLYRLPGPENHPDMDHIIARRRSLSPHFATSQAELDWRARHPLRDVPSDPPLVKIKYLGIWDTVGALGIPTPLLGGAARWWNRKYAFHDTKLSHMVQAARHAIGLDERRVFYQPSLWDNLEQSREGPGLNAGDRSPTRPYQQVWFTGTHAIVGGASEARGLAAIPLDWVTAGAMAAGLVLDPRKNLLDAPMVPDLQTQALRKASLVYRLAANLLKWRAGPGHPIDLHDSVRTRLGNLAGYRPQSLRNLMPELFSGQGTSGARPRPPSGGGER